MGRHKSSLRELGWGVSNSPNPWKQGSAKRVVRTLDYSNVDCEVEKEIRPTVAEPAVPDRAWEDRLQQLQHDGETAPTPHATIFPCCCVGPLEGGTREGENATAHFLCFGCSVRGRGRWSAATQLPSSNCRRSSAARPHPRAVRGAGCRQSSEARPPERVRSRPVAVVVVP